MQCQTRQVEFGFEHVDMKSQRLGSDIVKLQLVATRKAPKRSHAGYTWPEMSALTWTSRILPLRNLPGHVSTPPAVARLLGHFLDVPLDQVAVYPTKVATLQLKNVPACLEHLLSHNEWSLPNRDSEETAANVLILDTHFFGIIVIHDPPPGTQSADCLAIPGLANHTFGSWQALVGSLGSYRSI